MLLKVGFHCHYLVKYFENFQSDLSLVLKFSSFLFYFSFWVVFCKEICNKIFLYFKVAIAGWLITFSEFISFPDKLIYFRIEFVSFASVFYAWNCFIDVRWDNVSEARRRFTTILPDAIYPKSNFPMSIYPNSNFPRPISPMSQIPNIKLTVWKYKSYLLKDCSWIYRKLHNNCVRDAA